MLNNGADIIGYVRISDTQEKDAAYYAVIYQGQMYKIHCHELMIEIKSMLNKQINKLNHQLLCTRYRDLYSSIVRGDCSSIALDSIDILTISSSYRNDHNIRPLTRSKIPFEEVYKAQYDRLRNLSKYVEANLSRLHIQDLNNLFSLRLDMANIEEELKKSNIAAKRNFKSLGDESINKRTSVMNIPNSFINVNIAFASFSVNEHTEYEPFKIHIDGIEKPELERIKTYAEELEMSLDDINYTLDNLESTAKLLAAFISRANYQKLIIGKTL